MAGMGSASSDLLPNKRKYQSNDFNTELGLNWMDFHNRQYDPQIGRFLSVDPLAAKTDWQSSYAGMDNNPVGVIDPWGLQGFNLQALPMNNVSPSNYGAGALSEKKPNISIQGTDPNAPGGDAGWYTQVAIVLGNNKALDDSQPSNNNMNKNEDYDSNPVNGKDDLGTGGYSIGVIAPSAHPKSHQAPPVLSSGLNSGDLGNINSGTGYVLGALGNQLSKILVRNFNGYNRMSVIRTGNLLPYNVRVSTSALKTTSNVLKGASFAAGIAGLVVTGYQYETGQITKTEAIVDATFGVIGFFGPIGAGISIVYFGSKALYEYSTDDTVFEKPGGQ